MDSVEQSKWLDLAQKQTETGHWKPLDLTPIHFICIRPGRGLYIQCQQWENGQKFLNIYVHIYKSMSSPPIQRFVPNILVPQEAYKFVAAMDEVIRQLPVKEPQHPEGDESPLILGTQTVAGPQHYNFKLSAWHQTGGQWHFDIRCVKIGEEHKDTPQSIYFPFSALPWLRQQMVRMLEEHDGSQRIPKMPKILAWATPVITNRSAAPNIEQQWQQLNLEQEQVTETDKKEADDDDDADEQCPYCYKWSNCWRDTR